MTVQARAVGPAAALVLSASGAEARVHSVFPLTVNLSVAGARILVALTGPRGAVYPHAVVLDQAVLDQGAVPFRHVAAGDRGRLSADTIRLEGRCGHLTVALGTASWPAARVLPVITRRGNAWRAAARRLADFQVRAGCDLRLDSLVEGEEASTAMGTALRQAVLTLGRAARSAPGTALERAVASLVGMGTGLTPSGDDFLSGFLAAARASDAACPSAVARTSDAFRESDAAPTSGGKALVRALAAAVDANSAATGEISASLLNGAIHGYWPRPLVDLADALAEEDERGASAAVHELCGLGHSSGADIATGFLFGLAILAHAQGVEGPWTLSVDPLGGREWGFDNSRRGA